MTLSTVPLAAPSSQPITKEAMRTFTARLRSETDADGRVTPKLQATLDQLERLPASESARAVFQAFVAAVGGKMQGPIELPEDKTPFWLRGANHPLAGFQSNAKLPEAADVVIVGAGLTGTSAAYHLAGKGKVVVLEKNDPASGASSCKRHGRSSQAKRSIARCAARPRR